MTPLTVGLSVLGLVPFVVFGLGALDSTAASNGRMMAALIDYAGLVLAFTGGVHWGLAMRQQDDTAPPLQDDAVLFPTSGAGPASWQRLALGAAGLGIGWLALLMARLVVPWMALLVLIAGYIAAMVIEHHRRAWLPQRWVWVRWGFTVVAVAMLTTVLTLHLLGQTIVL